MNNEWWMDMKQSQFPVAKTVSSGHSFGPYQHIKEGFGKTLKEQVK